MQYNKFMLINPQLNDIDDCLYRVAAKAVIVQNGKVLLVREIPEMWWGFPGGGVDHGETVQSSLARECEEELGVPAKEVTSDFKIAHYTIGTVVNGIPRMNLFFKVSLPEELLKKTTHVAELGWFTEDAFTELHMSPSYDDRANLVDVIFGDSQEGKRDV